MKSSEYNFDEDLLAFFGIKSSSQDMTASEARSRVYPRRVGTDAHEEPPAASGLSAPIGWQRPLEHVFLVMQSPAAESDDDTPLHDSERASELTPPVPQIPKWFPASDYRGAVPPRSGDRASR
ncbi:hypothetical protein [Pseudorhodoferax sp. Leaf265]|uniref:hypothetical protein n=1 Tax=Pseudorhodoferax sp. Leaf265 TaxID=1736315 RepID=UPI0012E910AA|nr:hypothetical protein [Pseudorhodoferax sp. Leaf265]